MQYQSPVCKSVLIGKPFMQQTNILIPTDFHIQSLDFVKSAALKFADRRLNIILFHALHTPTDIQDLLFLPKGAPFEKVTESFRHACATLKRKHSKVIAQISFKCMYGNTTGVFKNFLEANEIHCIYMPSYARVNQVYKNSVEPLSLFKNAPVPFITTVAATEHKQKVKNQVQASNRFFPNDQIFN